jgi:RNA-directed DNA polymerase
MATASKRFRTATVASVLGLPVASLRELASRASACYTRYPKRKRGGGSRLISAPSDELKEVQRLILANLLCRLPRRNLSAQVRTVDPVANARRHFRQRRIVALDVESAFPSVTEKRVRSALVRKGCSPDAARLVAALCTDRGALPQGAPTSNALLDLVLETVDHSIAIGCRPLGITYSRFADNLTFSGVSRLSVAERLALKNLKTVGLSLNPEKTERGGRGTPVDVTGIHTHDRFVVRPSTLSNVKLTVLEAVNGNSDESISSAVGAIEYVRRVNRRQAASLVSRLIPKDSRLAEALRARHSK